MGARKIGVFGIPPVGCLPFQRTLSGGIARICVEEYNQAAQLANAKLSAAINGTLTKKLPQSKLVFIDIYDPMLDLIVNPDKYGKIFGLNFDLFLDFILLYGRYYCLISLQISMVR